MLKIGKKYYEGINIYYIYIGYITIKKIDDYKSIYSVSSLYLCINHAKEYIEEKTWNKYLLFSSIDEKKVFKNFKQSIKIFAEVWDGIKNKIKAINGGE